MGENDIKYTTINNIFKWLKPNSSMHTALMIRRKIKITDCPRKVGVDCGSYKNEKERVKTTLVYLNFFLNVNYCFYINFGKMLRKGKVLIKSFKHSLYILSAQG